MRTFPWTELLPCCRWAGLLGAMLLCTGCVTLGPGQGDTSEETPHALSTTLREAGAPEPPLESPSALASTQVGGHALSAGLGEQGRLHRRRSTRGLGPAVALASAGQVPADEVASVEPAARGAPSCGGQAVPPGWPDFSSGDRQALLAPFLTCTWPADFLALQQQVDMPRLVEALDDWRAVRLGAQGPVREDAALLLNRKRASFLVEATERFGPLKAQVLALYLVHSCHDDDLRELLFLLARDKRLKELLGVLPAFQEALEARGLQPTARADRDFQWKDVGRGLARAGRDALSTSPMRDGGVGLAFSTLRSQLPPHYQEALDEAEKRWMEQHFSPGSVVLGGFDHLTFGVPLGFHGLVATTGQGVYSLTRGEYEQATRELAPAALLVGLYAGGRGMRALSEARGTPGVGGHLRSGPMALEARLLALGDTARGLERLLGVEGMRELARDIQASREAGRFVAVGGEDAALALYEARGNVAQARPLMSRARQRGAGQADLGADEAAHPTAQKAGAAERQGTLASLVDEGVGHTLDVVEAKLVAAELEATGPRLPRDVRVLEQHRPMLDAPPPEARGNPRWREYVDYYNRRSREVEKGTADEGPLKWEGYERMRAWFARGMAFERDMVRLLREDAKKPRAERTWLRDFDKPRVETQVGVRKPGPGLRYADVLVIEEGALGGRPRRVEAFSFKSRNLSGLDPDALKAQMIEDASEALQKYGETLDIRRGSLRRLFGAAGEVPVQRVRLVYEGGELKPAKVNNLKTLVDAVQEVVPGVEVLFQ